MFGDIFRAGASMWGVGGLEDDGLSGGGLIDRWGKFFYCLVG